MASMFNPVRDWWLILRLKLRQTIKKSFSLFLFVFRSAYLFQTYRTEPQHPEKHNETPHRPILRRKSLCLTLSFLKKNCIFCIYCVCMCACIHERTHAHKYVHMFNPHSTCVEEVRTTCKNHFSPSTSHRNKIYNLNVIEEKVGDSLECISTAKNSLSRTSTQALRTTINKWELMKL